MRLIAQLKQGYYPAPPEAIAGILRHLKIPDPPPDSPFKSGDVNVLDPCAGEAKALVQIAEGLGVSWAHVFAIELNASRSPRIAEAYANIRGFGVPFERMPLVGASGWRGCALLIRCG